MIGKRIADLRIDEGISQRQLAEILNINKHSVSSYERGKSAPPYEIIIELAKHLEVSTDYLLGLTDDPVPHTQRKDRYLRLPINFPMSRLSELEDFIEFLCSKETK